MKEEICNLYRSVLKDRCMSFSEAAKVSGISKTQVNNIVNHSGKECSLEKVLDSLCGLGYKVNFKIEEVSE